MKGGGIMSYTSTLFVGVDVSLNTNQVCACDFNQKEYFNLKFDNSIEGSSALVNRIVEIMNSFNFHSLTICMESTSMYFFHVANFLSSAKELNQFNLSVYALNPKVVANYRKSFVSLPKNDPSDAYLLADFARVGRCKQFKVWRGATLLALQRLTRHRYHLAEQMTREKNYVLVNVFLKFNRLKPKENSNDSSQPFSDLFGATSTAVLTEFATIEEIVQMPMEGLIAFIDSKGKHKFTEPEKVAKLLKDCARDSYRLDKVSYDAINVTIASSLRMISTIEREIKDIDKQIEHFANGLDTNAMTILKSIPGVGPVYAAGILAEIGSISAFENNDKLAKFAGITWNDHSSGNLISENNELNRTGNSYLRYYITQATYMFYRKDPIFYEYYTRKYNEALKHKHKRALALTSRKFVKLIHSMLRNNQLYSQTGEVTPHK